MTPPRRARHAVREGAHTGSSRGQALGYVQCNLAVVPQSHAFDFLLYCQRNPRACPVLEVCDPGSPEPRRIAPGAKLPSEAMLQAAFKVSRITVRQALAELASEGLIETVNGKGSFVTRPANAPLLGQLAGFNAVMHARGQLQVGERFVHKSIIDSTFDCRIESTTTVGDKPAIVPSVAGQAWITDLSTLVLDPTDPYPQGYRIADTWPMLG